MMTRLIAASMIVLSLGAKLLSDEPLNVLFIAVDDLRVQLGCYGDPVAITPYIDRLAARGVRFDRAYCQQAVCNPSRQSLLTGRRPDTLKVWDLKTHFRTTQPDLVTLPQYFKQHGYHAQAFGKIWHGQEGMSDPPSWSVPEQLHVVPKSADYLLPQNQGGKPSAKHSATEDADVDDEAYRDGQVAAAAVRAMRRIADRPFFLAVGFRKPHLPFSAPRRYWDLYDRAKIPMPVNPDAPVDAPPIALHDWRELRGYSDIPATGPISHEKMMQLRHGYYACISFMDAQVGRLLDELDRLSLAQRTIIVIWSDHGFHLGEHDLWGKDTNYEIGTRVPLIVSAPGRRVGASSDALVELVDLYPTLVELANLPMPSGLEGVSLAPLLDEPHRPWKTAAFSQFPRPWFYRNEPDVMGYSLRTDRYRYVEWRSFRSGAVEARELYDHSLDPNETVNVAGHSQRRETAARLQRMLNAGWRAAIPADAGATPASSR